MALYNYLRFFTLTALLLAFSLDSYSQMWKRRRQELMFGIGATNFLGELGGRNDIGRPFIIDLNMAATRPSVNFGYLYRTNSHSKLRGSVTWGMLRGNDQLTLEAYRNNRNLHFRSHIAEFSGIYEFMFNKEYSGHRYQIKGAKTRFRSVNITFYGFGGIGGFYFNPQAYYKGNWVNLQPLGTEGQGLEGMPDKYSRISLAIPMGAGFRYSFTEKFRVGVELSYRKTFTDYIDDISTDYFDNHKLRKARGDVAAEVADPNKGMFPYQLDETGKSLNGMQRGNPKNMDAYMFFMVNVYYTLPPKVYKYKF